jgi:hypothetical protein
MRKNVFLFGAGASHGAGSILPERPPLGLELYSELARLFPGSWGGLPLRVASVLAKDFEKGMEVIYAEFGSSIPQLMREMAIYFIEFRPVGNRSLYCKLVQELLRNGSLSRTVFSTINYDCVLEFSLLNHNQRISYFDPQCEKEVPVMKLHGSCNMFNASIGVSQNVRYGTGVSFSGDVKAILDINKVIETCLVVTGLAPVMCLYMREKPLNVSADVILAIQKKWSELIAEAETLAIVGVNPLYGDTHIWEPIAKSKARKFYVGNKECWASWVKTNKVENTEYLGPRFSAAFYELCYLGGIK